MEYTCKITLNTHLQSYNGLIDDGSPAIGTENKMYISNYTCKQIMTKNASLFSIELHVNGAELTYAIIWYTIMY